MCQICMTDAGTTQNNFILPAPPVGGLPISQDWLDRMKLVYDRTVPIILPSEKDILVDYIFEISVGYANLPEIVIKTETRLSCINSQISDLRLQHTSIKIELVLVSRLVTWLEL